MVWFTCFVTTVMRLTSPWQAAHSTPARTCGAWRNWACAETSNLYTRTHGTSRFFSAYWRRTWTPGPSVATFWWQSMHFRTEGMPASACESTVMWQSMHSRPFSTCLLCGNSMGCSCAQREAPKTAGTASSKRRRFGIKRKLIGRSPAGWGLRRRKNKGARRRRSLTDE